MEIVTVSPEFQVVIPRAIRESLGIQPGQQVQIIRYGDRIELVPVKSIQETRGFLKVLIAANKERTTERLEDVIDTAQGLPPLEQLELISRLSQSLRRSYLHIQPTQDFWEPKTIDQLTQTQQPSPVTDMADFRADFWPEDESADDLIDYVYQQRQEDRSRDG